MLGTESDSNHTRRNSAQKWPTSKQFHRPRERQRLCTPQSPLDDAILKEYLKPLSRSSRKFPPFLHRVKLGFRERSFEKSRSQDVRGRNGILNRQIDSDTADR